MDQRVKTIFDDIWALCSKAFEIAKIDPIVRDRDLSSPEDFSLLLSSGEYQASLDVYQTLYEYEMTGFLIYLGLSGGSMNDDELRFIREYDSICRKPKFANSLGQASAEAFSNSVGRIFDVNFYEKDVPYVFKTAVEADLIRVSASGDASFSGRLYVLVLRLGEDFLALGGDEDGRKMHGFDSCMCIVKGYIDASVGAGDSSANHAQQLGPEREGGRASPALFSKSEYNDARDFNRNPEDRDDLGAAGDLRAAVSESSRDGERQMQDAEEALPFEERFGRFLMDHSESILIRHKFFGLLRDVFPGHRLQTNLLSILHEMGIAAEIENSPRIDNAFAFRFEKRLTEEYGIVQNYAEWAVSVWCEFYGGRTLGRQCDIRANPSEDRSK
ncbi:MAG: hypothetical protein LBO21_01420 [Synergistaceae bacterium]|jgi:hypothetical protein|nr:hypothetical protein [Synergistaceae bacterium]